MSGEGTGQGGQCGGQGEAYVSRMYRAAVGSQAGYGYLRLDGGGEDGGGSQTSFTAVSRAADGEKIHRIIRRGARG